MSELTNVVKQLKADWSEPRIATHQGKPVAVPLVCRFEIPVNSVDLANARKTIAIPPELLEFWQYANGASLFIDETYGQWGVHLWPVRVSIEETEKFSADRSRDFRRGDLVVGEFLGDSDLLLVRCDPNADDYGSVIIALPLDDRSEWDRAALSLEIFLLSYARTHGEKFWR